MRLRLEVQQRSTSKDIPPRVRLAAFARAALADLGDASVEVTLRLVDEEEGAALNERFRGRAGATNVLSFPFAHMHHVSPYFLGDIVICAPIVAREAEAARAPLEDHWAHVLVHGIMHLRGYDHVSDQDAGIMEGLEAAVLGRLGIANPYASR